MSLLKSSCVELDSKQEVLVGRPQLPSDAEQVGVPAFDAQCVDKLISDADSAECAKTILSAAEITPTDPWTQPRMPANVGAHPFDVQIQTGGSGPTSHAWGSATLVRS